MVLFPIQGMCIVFLKINVASLNKRFSFPFVSQNTIKCKLSGGDKVLVENLKK